MTPRFFPTPAKFRTWLQGNHATTKELWLGFYKKDSGRPSITWPESVDQALCFGWIDGIRKTYGPDSYMIRFTPRRPRSNWSDVNIGRVRKLKAQGLMRVAGLKAFAHLDVKRSGIYSFERAKVDFDVTYKAQFQRRKRAWDFFQSQPPGYRKTTIWWVVSAKQEATRRRRLATLIQDCNAERRIGLLR